MDINTILYITLALIIALGFAFFQYLYKETGRIKRDYIFFALRALAVFLVLLILINPKITSTEFEVSKPELIVLTDNSQSIAYLKEEENLRNISESLANNEKIQKKFDVSRLYFGENLEFNDSLNFSAGGAGGGGGNILCPLISDNLVFLNSLFTLSINPVSGSIICM